MMMRKCKLQEFSQDCDESASYKCQMFYKCQIKCEGQRKLNLSEKADDKNSVTEKKTS